MSREILVVDDERDIEILFKQKFRREIKQGTLSFQFAFSAKEALEYLSAEQPLDIVLILSDINMPDMSGLELLKIIKESHPQLHVYIITAYGDDRNYKLAMELGADHYITKPIEFNQLKEQILQLTNP